MRPTSTQLLVWAPRLLGLALCLFLGLFALDGSTSARTSLARWPTSRFTCYPP